MGNREIGWPKSLYVHKREIGEGCRYEFGPAWDFDICMNTKQVFDDVVVIKAPDLPMWLNPMFEVLVEYDEFRKAYRKKSGMVCRGSISGDGSLSRFVYGFHRAGGAPSTGRYGQATRTG